ncbi:MAG: hydroxyacid dehydrogenase [Chitinophagales bacterium]|nr:hydroxyacid dehydrogenase [Chitinophagales bacterium]
MNDRVLITSPDIHPVMDERLKKMGYEVDAIRDIDKERLADTIADYVGIIISSSTIMDKSMIDKASKLKFIARAGSGMEIVDIEYAETKNIRCLSSPEGNCDAVAEHAIAMLLALFNRLIIVDKELSQKIWLREENRGEALEGKTVSIIGFGHTGAAFAQRLEGFKCKVIAYDKYKSAFSSDHVTEVSMDEVFERSDIVSLHLPLTKETTFLVNNAWLSNFSKDIYIVNTARGKIVNTADMLSGLDSGHVKGACLDVLENETPSSWTTAEKAVFERLIQCENVVITPHIAGWTALSKLRLAEVLADKIELI